MIPSMDNRGPIPFAENIHRTKTFPPPCFTVGITYLESFRAPLRRLTYCLPSLPNRLKQKLVGKTNFFPIIYSPILMFKSKLSSGLLISFANERGLPADTGKFESEKSWFGWCFSISVNDLIKTNKNSFFDAVISKNIFLSKEWVAYKDWVLNY